jgi:rhamnosyltransferase
MIYAGVILYNPNQKRLMKNINAIIDQVDKLIVYNNGISSECSLMLQKLNKEKIIFLGSGKNRGMSIALNEIMNVSKKLGAEWVITMDQDSISPDNLVDTFKKRMDKKDVGIICPRFIDKRRFYMTEENYTSEDSYVDRCITSASCTRISAWEDVGKYDDFLFIDLIDNDFSKRMRIKGWKVLKVNSILLDQELGDITPKSPSTIAFYRGLIKHIKNRNLATNVAKLSYKKNVSPMRVYYTNRNIIYLNKKLFNYGGIGYTSYGCNNYFQFMIIFNLAAFVRGKEKMKILKAIIKGIRDGKRSKVTIFEGGLL